MEKPAEHDAGWMLPGAVPGRLPESQPAPTPLLLSCNYTSPFGQDFWQFCNMSLADTVAKFTQGVAQARLAPSCPEFPKKKVQGR